VSLTLLGALARMDEGRHRAELYRAWLVGQGAGFASAVSLEKMGPIGSRPTEEMRRYLIVGIQQGKPLTTLVKARPKLFGSLEAALLATGDEAGKLDTSLRLLADHFGREYRRMLKVSSQLSYAIFAGVVGSFALALPVLHRSGWRAFTIAVFVLLAGFLLLGGLPISILAGILSGGAALIRPRFARALAMGMEAGLPLARVVRLAVDASGSADLRAHIASRSERELGTMKLADLFDGCRSVPGALLGQMAVADASGDYLNTLKRYADEIDPPR
jgi:type II secretory pathway component PulF